MGIQGSTDEYSGGLNVVAAVIRGSDDIGRSESGEVAIKSKPERQATGGVWFVIRMCFCLALSKATSLKRWNTDPIEISVNDTIVVQIL